MNAISAAKDVGHYFAKQARLAFSRDRFADREAVYNARVELVKVATAVICLPLAVLTASPGSETSKREELIDSVLQGTAALRCKIGDTEAYIPKGTVSNDIDPRNSIIIGMVRSSHCVRAP